MVVEMQGQPEYQDRLAAREASKGCRYCGGNGLASVWHPEPSHEKRNPATIAAYCTCDHGRWIKRNHAFAKECRHLARSFPDLEDVLRGESKWLPDPPELDQAAGREAYRKATLHAVGKMPEPAAVPS